MPSPTRRAGTPAACLLLLCLLAGCARHDAAGPYRASATATPPDRASSPVPSAARALARVEGRFRARLGVYVLDTGTGRTVTYGADERFAYCSTSKALAVGVLLGRVTGRRLDHVVRYGRGDLLDHAPITSRHVDTGMRLRDIVAAALDYSDNTAENLVLARIGGPSGLQAALRAAGDGTTRADRNEPALNEARPGDLRDTSTPRALGTDLRRFVLGNALPARRRRLLTGWLLGNTTGDADIRAGVPAGWRVGDKTGSGGYGTRDDIAIAWPPGRSPVVIAVLSDRGAEGASSGDALIADATRAALSAIA